MASSRRRMAPCRTLPAESASRRLNVTAGVSELPRVFQTLTWWAAALGHLPNTSQACARNRNDCLTRVAVHVRRPLLKSISQTYACDPPACSRSKSDASTTPPSAGVAPGRRRVNRPDLAPGPPRKASRASGPNDVRNLPIDPVARDRPAEASC